MEGSIFFRAIDRYDNAVHINEAVEFLLAGCGIDALVKPETRVLLKVNLLMKSHPDEAVTTHPAVVAAVVAALKRRSVRDIIIADSPGGPFTVRWLQSVYEGCGMAALTGDGVALNYDISTRKSERAGGAARNFDFLSAILDADLVINLPKMKTHAMMGLTGAVKNCFGAVPGLHKPVLHYKFPKRDAFGSAICDICRAVAPAISLVDAITGMEGDGPSAGTPRDFGFLAAGRDPFLLDRALCHALGVETGKAHTVAASIARGLAPVDADELSIAGDREFFDNPIADLKLPHSIEVPAFQRVPGFLRPVVRWYLSRVQTVPVIREADCIGCGRCAQICPKQVIAIRDKKAIIAPAECIHCFCCHEVCPERAIDIKKQRRRVAP